MLVSVVDSVILRSYQRGTDLFPLVPCNLDRTARISKNGSHSAQLLVISLQSTLGLSLMFPFLAGRIILGMFFATEAPS